MEDVINGILVRLLSHEINKTEAIKEFEKLIAECTGIDPDDGDDDGWW